MMSKNKKGTKKSESREKDESAAAAPAGMPPPGKLDKETGDAERELFGVHVINPEDTENHFGSSEIKAGEEDAGKSGTGGTNRPATAAADAGRPKAEVQLELDGRVWQEAKEAAARTGIEIAKYVELALERFRTDPSK